MSAIDEKKEAHRELPDAKALGEAGEILIKDKDGKELPLKSLYTDKPKDERQLIVFIRHFHCGSCKQYVEALVQDLPPEKLSKANVALSIIGCGEAVCIGGYAAELGCAFPIYADPSVRSYKALGMVSTLRPGATTPSYLKRSTLDNVFGSLWRGITSGYALSGGPKAQNGGEWLFRGGELRWCHRMRNPTDHTETEDLKKLLELK